MAYQFVHVETYAPKPRKIAGSPDQFNSIEQVFGEAARDPSYSRHVAAPAKPRELMIAGVTPLAELRSLHDTRRSQIRETVHLANGQSYERELKSDFPTLYTEIHSHPMPAADFTKADFEERRHVIAWAERAINDFRARMSDGVKFSAVLHRDEGHVHFHILAVNLPDPKLSANKLHVGKVAAQAFREAGSSAAKLSSLPRPELERRPKKPKKPRPSKNRVTQEKQAAAYTETLAAWDEACAEVDAANTNLLALWEKQNASHLHQARKARGKKQSEVQAFQDAMSEFQERYFKEVGQPSGLLRMGPALERLPAKQYAARKARAREIAGAAQANAREAARLAAQSEALVKREERVSLREAEISRSEAALADRAKALDAQEKRLNDREREIVAAEEAMSGLLDQIDAGSVTLTDGQLRIDAPSPYLMRLSDIPPDARSRPQRLVARFIGLLKRVAETLTGRPEQEAGFDAPRPGE